MVAVANLGYPRIGRRRDLKRATESYWSGKASRQELLDTAQALRRANWARQRELGVDLVPTNDFSLYDHVLDTVALVGAVPERYQWDGDEVDLDTYFAMARGAQREGLDVMAMEMTKWFDTNYHYIVPEFRRGQRFRLSSTKPFAEFQEACSMGIAARPVLLGPCSFLLLGKAMDPGLHPLQDLLDPLLEVYRQVLDYLADLGADWVQMDEPCLVQDRSDSDLAAYRHAYTKLAESARVKVHLQTYFGHIGEAYETVMSLPVAGVGLDLVRGRHNLDLIRSHGFPPDKVLGAGIVNGRNVWVNDLDASLRTLEELTRYVPEGRLMIGPSCSLLHVPLDAGLETRLAPELRSWLAFADQKLAELALLKRALLEGRQSVADQLTLNQQVLSSLRRSEEVRRPEVQARLASVVDEDYQRRSPYPVRREAQRQRLDLPQLPTTTIGSFPQTADVRRMRRLYRDGQVSREEYEAFLKGEIARCIALQEELGLDVLVHGEFERTDMVEYFAEQLTGFAFTEHGWVQSYGSRYVRPPLIFGDVSRPKPMTVDWITYAQSLTSRPVKGMLTGPVTMLNWSFVREDQEPEETCRQIALALRDEVLDLEKAGIKIIQIDEPALREGLPLRRAEWGRYLSWAVACFRLASAGVRDDTQIHTHMCYSQFGDIIGPISQLDADVVSVGDARANKKLLSTLREQAYDKEIGPGVYDIHSPRVPPVEEMAENVRATLEVLAREQVWVNPDCGLKTRTWPEVTAALRNMVAAAHALRAATAGV